MTIPMPLGQYVPGDSWLHRLEPRAKLAIVVALMIGLFASSGWAGIALVAIAVATGAASARIRPGLVMRGLKPLAILLAFTLTLNAVRIGADDALVSVGAFDLSESGLLRGLFFAARIVLLVAITTVLTLTTSPVALTDAIARLLKPFERVGVPATDIAMMLSIAMRFVPTTAEETDRIMLAQTARGARFDRGGPIARGRAFVPVLVPLFVNLFRRAEELAAAMESRAYRGTGRTRLNESRFTGTDWLVVGTSALTAAAVAVYL